MGTFASSFVKFETIQNSKKKKVLKSGYCKSNGVKIWLLVSSIADEDFFHTQSFFMRTSHELLADWLAHRGVC
jgi:hypothetical protein